MDLANQASSIRAPRQVEAHIAITPPIRDALWTGGEHRAVPDGLRKLAAGDDGNSQDENQSALPTGGGNDGDPGDDNDDDDDGTGKDGEVSNSEERKKDVRLPRKHKHNRQKPKHRPGVWPYRGGTTTWERWSLIFRGGVFPKHCDYGPDCTC